MGLKLNQDMIRQYVATILPTNTNVKYDKLKLAGVSGVVFNAGTLFDGAHLKRSEYANSNLVSQVASATKVGLRYGLYATVRAYDQTDAEEECRELRKVLRDFTPTLGIWLKLELPKSKTTNDKILSVYHTNLTKWGFQHVCGLYATRKQLESISWDKFENKFYLWITDHLDELDVLENALTPELFNIEETQGGK